MIPKFSDFLNESAGEPNFENFMRIWSEYADDAVIDKRKTTIAKLFDSADEIYFAGSLARLTFSDGIKVSIPLRPFSKRESDTAFLDCPGGHFTVSMATLARMDMSKVRSIAAKIAEAEDELRTYLSAR